MLSNEWLPRYRLLENFTIKWNGNGNGNAHGNGNGNAYDRGDYNSSFALRAVELKRCRFYDEFSALYGCRGSTMSKTTMASDQHVTPIKNHKRKLNETPTLAFLKAQSRKQEELTNKRDEDSQKRHSEN